MQVFFINHSKSSQSLGYKIKPKATKDNVAFAITNIRKSFKNQLKESWQILLVLKHY